MILILHQTSQRGKFILPPKQVFQQFLLHLTSERSLTTFLIVHLTFERSTFILLPKVVFQQFLLFLTGGVSGPKTNIQTYPISYMSLSTIDHLRLVHLSESQVPTVIKTYLTRVPKDCPTDI